MTGRACSMPIAEFNHLSLKEVAEHEKLSDLSQSRKLTPDEKDRFMKLDQRRIKIPKDGREDVA